MRGNTRDTRLRWRLIRFAGVASLAIGLASPAAFAGNDDDPTDKPRRIRVTDLIPEAIMTRAEQYDVLMRFRIKKRVGIEYRQPVELGDRTLSFRVHGPVVRKKAFGIGVEIKF